MSHDEQSILITTYTELKHCLDQSFTDGLLLASNPQTKPNQLQHMQQPAT